MRAPAAIGFSKLLGLILIVAAGKASGALLVAPPVFTSSATPGQPNHVVASCQVTTGSSDPTLLSGGVNLVRLTASGAPSAIIGVMHDDGSNGDAVSGDGVYSLSFDASSSSRGQYRFQCTAAFQNTVRRVRSNAVSLLIERAPTVSAGPDQTIAESWELLVASNALGVPPSGREAVLRFDGGSGSFLNAVTPIDHEFSYPSDLFVDAQKRLLVSVRSAINRYEVTSGAFIDSFVKPSANGPSPISAPFYQFGPDGDLYVKIGQALGIDQYDGSTGAFKRHFATLPAISGGGMTFGPDGNLYVIVGQNALKFDGQTGDSLGTFANFSGHGLFYPTWPLFGPDGNLYVSGLDSGNVARFNGSDGTFIDIFVAPHSGGLQRSYEVQFGPDRNLYVSDLPADSNTGQVLRYDGATGQFIDRFIPPNSGGLLRAAGFLFNRLGSSVTLSGTISDDGLPSGVILSSTWSKLSGPGVVNFSDARAVSTRADFSVPGTYVLRLTASDSQLTSSSDVTIVVTPANSISSVTPGSGAPGNLVAATVVGLNTHFSQGLTQASFGSGITVDRVSVADATHATVTLTIDPAASPGPRVVTVTTGTEVASLSGGFTVVLNQVPVITSLPPTGPVWENIPSVGPPPPGRAVGFSPSIYDDVNDRLIFFSGDYSITTSAYVADVWVLANASGLNGTPTWTQLVPSSPGPSGSVLTSMNYVKASNRLIVCGGNIIQGQCWVLTNANGLGGTPAWIQLPSMPNGPFGSSAYDSSTNRLMMVAFTSATSSQFMILSDADATGSGTPTWSQPAVIGTPPSGNFYENVAYDPNTNRLIYWGGDYRPTPPNLTYPNELWILTNANGTGGTPQWIKQSPTGGPPAGREGPIFSYDPQSNTAVLFGGITQNIFGTDGSNHADSSFTDLWQLSNANGVQTPQWTQLSPTGRTPLGHYLSVFGRDSVHHVLPMALGRWLQDGPQGNPDFDSALYFADNWRLDLGVVNAVVGTNFSYAVTAADSDGSTLNYALTQSPAGMSISSTTGVITYVPTAAQIGTQSVTVRVDNGRGLSATQTFQVIVVPAAATTSPTILSVVPAVGQIGTSLDVTVTCQNSSFVAGQTSAMLYYNGSGAAPETYPQTATVLSPTTVVVHLTIRSGAPAGSWNLNVGDGFEIAEGFGVFTVQSTPVVPVITSVSPSSGLQGSTVTAAITGQYTHFAQGVSQASFGTGVTVTSLSVTSATHATATVNIASTAPVGSNTVTISTGTEVASLVTGFTVLAGPTLTSINPATGGQGQQSLSVTISGQNTHFVQGTTTVNLGVGVTVISVVVASATSASAVINIDAAAAFGTRNVTVTTGTETAMLASGFTVTATTLVPNVIGLTPDLANSAITGANLSPGTVNASSQPITLNFNQLPSSQGFTYEVLTTPGYTGRGNVPEGRVFSVSGGVLDINTIGLGLCGSGGISYGWQGIGDLKTPFTLSFTSRVLQEEGNTSNPYGFYVLVYTGREFIGLGIGESLIVGQDGKSTTAVDNTVYHAYRLEGQPGSGYQLFVDNVLVLVGGPGYSPGSVAAYQSFGLYGGGLSFDNGTCGENTHAQMTAFSFQQAQGFVAQQSPTQGTRVPVASTVNYSALFEPNGRPYVSAGPDQTVPLSQTVNLAGQVIDDGRPVGWSLTIGWSMVSGPGTVTFTNPSAATTTATFSAPGLYIVRLTASDGQYPNYADATITVTPAAGTPQLISFNPTSAHRGSTLNVTIVGQSTHFLQGATVVNFDSSVTVNSVTVSSPTQLTANLTVEAVAVSGPRTVTAATGSEIVGLTNVLSIGNGTPVISSVTPNSGQQGQTLTVNIAGTFTEFLPGVTTASFGAGITVTTLTVNSPTSATAVLAIDPATVMGYRSVKLTTGTEVDTLTNGFSVLAGAAAPSISSISPNAGPHGQSGPVGIVGQNTHFVQGQTTVDFGPGIVVSGITVGCPTCLTATLQVAPNAVLGPRTVAVTTGTEVVSAPGGFTVVVSGGGPILTSLAPASGQLGQTVIVNMTGQNTHWAQATTQVSFGAGITISGINVSGPTALSAQLTIDPTATAGSRTPVITTGTEIVSAPNIFTVNPATAFLLSLNPGGSGQGTQAVPVSITGQNTHFVQGTSTADFGAGITVASFTVTSPTAGTAVLNINSAAVLGPRTVTVATGAEIARFVNGFSVQPPTGPFLLSLNPGGSSQGALNLPVSITGQSTHFLQGSSVASFGPGISVNSLTVNTPTDATASVTIDPTATVGPRTVSVTTNAEVATFQNGFSVVPGTIGITSIDPGGGAQGSRNLSLAVTGQFTHFLQGSTTAAFSGTGITAASVTVTSPTTATVVVNVDSTATVGPHDVTLTTGSEVVIAPGGFTVSVAAPKLLSAVPNAGSQGQRNLTVQLTGQLTHFAQSATQANFGAGITVSSVTVNSPTSATAVLSIDPTAAAGPRTVSATSGGETVTLSNGFAVQNGTPIISSVTPSSGVQNQQNISISISGQFTHFVQGSTQVTFGPGISLVSLSVGGPTSLTAVINIAPGAPTGSSAVTVNTGAEVATLANAFTVQPSVSGPITVSPSSGMQTQSLSVNLTAVDAHFVAGMTVARFGPGVIVGSGFAGGFGPITVITPTTATAQLTIIPSALPAARTVTVQTGAEQISSPNAFIVTGLPFLSNVSPNAGSQGTSGTVTLQAAYTNFTPGATRVSLGAGIAVGGGPVGGFGPVTVTSATSATAQITIDPAATLGLRTVSAQTGTELAKASNGFSVLGPVTGPAPSVSITSPTEASDVSAPTTVTGTATSPNLDSWTLDYQAVGASSFTTFAIGTTAAVSGVLDPTVLLNGNTVIRLTAIDTSGQTTGTTITVVVTKNLKIGNFTVSFNDLTVPAGPLPIQVVRTYDSRNKSISDFGVGWTLDLKTVRLTTNGPLGDQWVETSRGGPFPSYCLDAVKPHKVTVVLPEGTTYEFVPALSPMCQPFNPIQNTQVAITFTPVGDTPPNVKLALAGNSQPYVIGAVPGNVLLTDLDNVTTFDPDAYLLTLPDGRVLQLSVQTGLQTITDLNGNVISVTPTGITSSTGSNVAFVRDSLNRITQITDPAGNQLAYNYDNHGDLISFTDQVNQTSTYSYDSNHGLQTIKDPRGVQPLRNDYDLNGRLVSHTDAYGNVVNYDHSTGTNQEIVTDRLNNVTVNEYDAQGNIIKVTDALGGITDRTYDSLGNLKTEKNALGKTKSYTYDAQNNRTSETDPLGHTTSYVYNSRNQVLTITGALGRITTNVYDAAIGNLLSTTDAAGQTTSYLYYPNGQQKSITDPLGSTTSFQYDNAGNLSKTTDALGNSTDYLYDASGNKIKETRTRTTKSGVQSLVTSYQYDKLNRLTKTTYPDGSTTQIQYNALGKQAATIDQLNRQTTYLYDLMGRLILTTYPDGTTESSTYDAEGDRVTSTDRGSRTTTFIYDQLKRLKKTVYADTTSISTTYDAIGQVTATTDARGNATQYQYDDAGHRTQVQDALGRITSFQYDAVGNQMSATDANLNTTQFQYDPLNRRTATLYPDTTTDGVVYDALGRTISKKDQAGITTQFLYDKLGHLIQVTDALNQTTKYTYDEVGNRLTQTDANLHTTVFEYDALGRRIKRTLPLGMSEVLTYDVAGNLKTKTDFNGKTTTYGYDPQNNWLTSKIPDASFAAPTVGFAYTATGQRRQMVDASGTTSYQYDVRDRLRQKGTPEGTLTYTYDLAGNLSSIRSSNANGTSVDYTYDALNRLSTVVDHRLASGTTSYLYDPVGNLQKYAYPNGVQTAFQYNNLNRLKNVTISSGSTLASYAYQLGQTGNRTQVNELDGRQVNYTYDNLYRLTNETIAGTTSANGTMGYLYDFVGNRLSRSSTVAPVPAATSTYDANDWLTSDTYDEDGNTTVSGTNAYAYDFENHLRSQNGAAVSIVYDGDGNRVSKTTSGATTQYLVDDRNLTGYAQVVEELTGGAVQRVYTYGLNRISQSQASGTSFYGYDGHGSVRLLTDATGAVTDRYDYDAFGNQIAASGTTLNNYRFAGEQYDPELGLIYLRARYLSPGSGRFQSIDPEDGDDFDPFSLHKYLYAGVNPVNNSDPSGRITVAELATSTSIYGILFRVGVSSATGSIFGALDAFFGGRAVGAGALQGLEAGGLIGLSLEVKILRPILSALGVPISIIGITDALENKQYSLAAFRSVAFLAPSILFSSVNKIDPGRLSFIGPSEWVSSEGLRYGGDPIYGNRVLHVLDHASDNPGKALQGVFTLGRADVLPLLDDAYATLKQSPARYFVRSVGGEKRIEFRSAVP